MKHQAASSILDRPTFSTAARDILSGRLPLWGTLTDRQKDAGVTDCAIVAVDWTLPGCLAIAVLRNRRIAFVGSFQSDTPIFWGERGPDDFTLADEPPINEMLMRFSAAMRSGHLGSVVTLDDPKVARTFVEAFSQHEQAA